MKKKITVTFQVQYETEIEVDTDLPEGNYNLDDVFDINRSDYSEEIEDEVNNIIESQEVFDINIPANEKSSYRTNSFEIVNIIV